MQDNNTQDAMRKLILVAHTSLDGFVAGQDGGLEGFEAGEENLDFLGSITDDADAALFGRVSYQLLETYWPSAETLPNASAGTIKYSRWYNRAHKIVLSKSLDVSHSNNTVVIRENIFAEVSKLKKQDGKNILIFGSPTAFQSLVQLDLVDGCWIFINPVIVAQGISLFAGMKNKTKLSLLATKEFTNGEIALHYIVDRK